MSIQSSKLCSTVIGETFGTPIQTIADVLLTRGPSPFRHILTEVAKNMPIAAIQDALKSLIQHSVVTFHSNPTSGDIIYTLDHDRAIELVRFPRYYHLVETIMGSPGREVFEEIVQAGLIPISKLLYVCGFRATSSNPDITESELMEKLDQFHTAVLKLVTKKFIMIIPPPPSTSTASEESSVVIEREGSNVKDLYAMPLLDLSVLCAKLLDLKTKNPLKLDSLPDAGTLWSINVTQLQAELRNSVVLQGIERKFSSMIDPRVIQVIIDVGFEKHPWEDEGTPVSLPEIKDRIEKLPGGDVTSKNVLDHIEVVEDDPLRIVTKLSNTQGGYFSFNMKTAVSALLWSTVDRVITETHGFHALRIFRLVKANGFAEQDNINELGMVPGKDAKNLTYKLVADGFLNIKEVKKSYTANAPPGKTVFCIDPIQIVRSLQEHSFKAILNMKLKSQMEQEKIKRLSSKEERIARILVNMTNKNCTEEQLEEIRELLTPPERSLLMRYQFASGKLLSGAVQVEETLFITELYMKYHARKVVPKTPGGKKDKEPSRGKDYMQ